MDQLQTLDYKDPTTIAAIVIATIFLFMIIRSQSKVDVNAKKSVVVVTGCDSGFGLGLCHKLSAEGYLVIATCMTKEGIERIKDQTVGAIICDVTKEDDITALSKLTYKYIDTHPDTKLWALINNAGIPLTGCVDWLPIEAFRKIMEVNYFAPIRLVKEFLPLLKRSKHSRIINLSSLAGFLSGQCMGPYSGSKHALEGVGKAMRDELAPWNIHVVHINPGFMATNILDASAVGARKYFESAPVDIQQQYGPGWLDNLGQTAHKTKQDPSIVVNRINDILTQAHPSFNQFPGTADFLRYFLGLSVESLSFIFSCLDPEGGKSKIAPTDTALRAFQK